MDDPNHEVSEGHITGMCVLSLFTPLPNTSRASQTPEVHPSPPPSLPPPLLVPPSLPSCCHLRLETLSEPFIPLLAISLSTLSHHPTIPPIAPLIVSFTTSVGHTRCVK